MMKKTKPISEESASPIKINRSRDSGKKRVDLFARLRNTEHPLDNILPEVENLFNTVEVSDSATSTEIISATEDIINSADQSYTTLSNDNPPYPIQPNTSQSNPTQSNTTFYDNTQFHHLQKSVSPSRDYQKVPNSITRNAIPNKLFRGTSKNTYDVLYLKTRGSINPSRFIEATKRELMKWTGVSHVTIFKHIKHLQSVRLIKVEHKMGSQDGSVYEVFIPEEISEEQTTPVPYNPSQAYTTPAYPTQPDLPEDMIGNPTKPNKIALDQYHNISPRSMGDIVEKKDSYGYSKDSLKTTNSDDDGFTSFIRLFQIASEEITGKKLTCRDEKHLESLAQLLILELKIAAQRTDNVSSVPAFLTEVLRRKLRNLPTTHSKSQKAKIDTVGKSEKGEYKIKALSQKEREAALAQLQEFANEEFLTDFKKWYIEEDWNWMMTELKNEGSR